MISKNGIHRLFLAFALMALLSSCSQYKVYSVRDNPTLKVGGGMLYALPKTQVRISVVVERRSLENAPYAEFAADYIGVGEVDTSYHIVSIDLDNENVADPDNYYFVMVRRGSVAVDNRHLLLAIGMNPVASGNSSPEVGQPASSLASGRARQRAEYNLYDRADTFYTRYDTPDRPSLVSTRKDVRSLRQRAMAAAERLAEIQAKQQELLNGEYEGSYGAESVKYLFGQLRRQEEEIITSFCGTLRRETVTFVVAPPSKRKVELSDTIVWFSPSQGFFDSADNLPGDASPIVCGMVSDNELKGVDRFVRYHTSGVTQNSSAGRTGTAASKYRNRKGFRYRIPLPVQVSVTSPYYSVEKQLFMSQMGPIVELPRYRIKAQFDPETLDLLKLIRR